MIAVNAEAVARVLFARKEVAADPGIKRNLTGMSGEKAAAGNEEDLEIDADPDLKIKDLDPKIEGRGREIVNPNRKKKKENVGDRDQRTDLDREKGEIGTNFFLMLL